MRYARLTPLLGVMTVAASLHLGAQAIPPDWPGPRAGGHALAFDSKRGVTLLYGDRGPDATTLWGWDGTRWTAYNAAGPGLRRHIKMAYDAARDRVVLFGGLDDSGRTAMGDTWEWNGTAWANVTAEGPAPRSSYSMIYDPPRRRVLLFGGLSSDGAMNDLWSWDGAHWNRLAEGGPSPRGEAGMVLDPRSGNVLVTAGTGYERIAASNARGFSIQRTAPPRDTWAWDGRAWHKLSDDGPARSFTALTNDPRSGVPLRIGGESGEGYHGDLWRWSGSAWSTLPDTGIPARHGVASALDTKRKRVVVYGGSAGSPQRSQSLGDLWEWDGSQWHEIKSPRS